MTANATSEHLAKMLEADEKLYRAILETPVFSYHFNELCQLANRGAALTAAGARVTDAVTYDDHVRFCLETALRSCGGSVAAASKRVGLARSSVYEMARRLEIPVGKAWRRREAEEGKKA